MQLWNIKTAPENASRGPRELFSTAETRVDVIDLARNEGFGDPGESGHVVIQILSGSVELTIGDDTTTCGEGTLVALEPGEAHSLRALEQSRLLLTFAPRPAPRGHSPGSA